MKISSCLSVAALVCAMGTLSAAYAQEEHMIGGKAVPADQVTEVQNKCNQLREEHPARTPPVGDAAAPAGAAPAGAAQAPAGAAPAGNPAAQPADNAAAPAGNGNAQASSGAGWMSDGSKIDIDQLTLDMCDEGKFVAPAM
jgi:hypothetical protein